MTYGVTDASTCHIRQKDYVNCGSVSNQEMGPRERPLNGSILTTGSVKRTINWEVRKSPARMKDGRRNTIYCHLLLTDNRNNSSDVIIYRSITAIT